MKDIIDKLGLNHFEPLPLLANGAIQTIVSYLLPSANIIGDEIHHVVDLVDGDKLALIENRPHGFKESSRIVLIVPGLAGSHASNYVARLAKLLFSQGYLVFRMNLRGCGAGAGLARFPYHAGRSDDVRTVIKWLKERFPNAPVTQVGFSLGASIILKMAGEDGSRNVGNLDSVVAVSPPLNLHASVELLLKNENWLFHRYFISALIRHEHKLRQSFPDLHPNQNRMPVKNIYEFDETYTAPRSGFNSAMDYYTRCSAKQFLEGIHLPTLILHSLDDPIISHYDFLMLPDRMNFDILLTGKGGHVGWIGPTSSPRNYRWMDMVIAKWIKWFDRPRLR
jgi:hypothetical protein